jgi:hypothetical protein
MASERERKEVELGRNRFLNVGQRRTLHAIDAQVEKERLKVKRISINGCSHGKSPCRYGDHVQIL